MREHVTGMCFVTLSALFSTSATAALIDFESFTLGTVLTDQLASQGIRASVSGLNPATIEDVLADALNPNDVTAQLPAGAQNGVRIVDANTADGFFDDVLTLTFVNPADGTTAATVAAFSFLYVSDTPAFGRLRAFNVGGAQIAADVSTVGSPGSQGVETLSVATADISYVEIDGFADVIIDQIDFSTPVAGVPEPSTLLLAALGLMGFVCLRAKT